eukprot:9867357-Alexandrium_andersonii.AAC.1
MAPVSRKRQASQEAPEVRPHRPLRLLTPRRLAGGAAQQSCLGCSSDAARTPCPTSSRRTGGSCGAAHHPPHLSREGSPEPRQGPSHLSG